MEAEYYTAKEAMTRLGISASSFHRLVSEGRIAKLIVPGKRYALYRKEDIESLAETFERVQESERGIPASKAYEQAEIAYSHTTVIVRYLFLAAESLPDQEIQATLTQLIERTKHISQMLEELQVDISKLVHQLQGR